MPLTKLSERYCTNLDGGYRDDGVLKEYLMVDCLKLLLTESNLQPTDLTKYMLLQTNVFIPPRVLFEIVGLN